ncbi:MAG: GNAT family N-acetyltransferase [Collimonas sp.]|uniref:GNAT family N-acetyltransferase n=1 Tax=Collimonas sp. TaxID=1963772 RepID=UPI003266D9E6
MAISVRTMHCGDATAVAELLPHLGYPGDADQIRLRFEALSAWPDNSIFLAEADGRAVGLCQVHGVRLIASDGYAEVAALVVHAKYQRRGIGKLLLDQADAWAAARGYARLRLRSGTHREDAHLFYEASGFVKSRASFAFERVLSQNQC